MTCCPSSLNDNTLPVDVGQRTAGISVDVEESVKGCTAGHPARSGYLPAEAAVCARQGGRAAVPPRWWIIQVVPRPSTSTDGGMPRQYYLHAFAKNRRRTPQPSTSAAPVFAIVFPLCKRPFVSSSPNAVKKAAPHWVFPHCERPPLGGMLALVLTKNCTLEALRL